MKYIFEEPVTRAKEAYPLICSKLAELKKAIESDGLKPTKDEVLKVFFNKMPLYELYLKFEAKNIEATPEYRQNTLIEEIKAHTKELIGNLELVFNTTISGAPIEDWELSGNKFKLKNWEKYIENVHSVKLDKEQVEAVNLLTDLTASLNKVMEWHRARNLYFPNLYEKRTLPYINGLGGIDLLEIMQKIK